MRYLTTIGYTQVGVREELQFQYDTKAHSSTEAQNMAINTFRNEARGSIIACWTHLIVAYATHYTDSDDKWWCVECAERRTGDVMAITGMHLIPGYRYYCVHCRTEIKA